MVVKRRKKITRQRGSRTCGWGLVHRGSGQRGGFGKAGSGKKAKCKMPQRGLWAIQQFGKHGFKPKGQLVVQMPINFREIEDRIEDFVVQKIATAEKDAVIIDLGKAGYNKLLGTGEVTKKFKIIVPFASKSAVEKVKAAGGEIISQEKIKTEEKSKEKGKEQ